ncbi:MAG TPA: glycosyltransferase [Syntrophorhabdaceae bacterium]|nr:glycosyltransferase [Syntrophorhabdaceae bacterium]
MKILYCFPEASNPNHYAYINIRSSLIEQGHSTVDFDFLAATETLGQQGMVKELRAVIEQERPDIFLHGIVSDELPVYFLDELRDRDDILSIAFFSDDDWRIYNHSLHWVGHYNFATTNDINALEIYRRFGFHHVFHMQYAANPRIYYPRKVPKIYDVTFVGQAYLGRPHIVYELMSQGIDVRVWGAGWEKIPELQSVAGPSLPTDKMIETFCASKIVLGFAWCSVPTATGQLMPQIKGRTFEYPACEAFQITYEDDRLKNYFNLGTEIATFRDANDLATKIRYYLDHDQERQDMAHAAYKRVLKDHTWKQRWDACLPLMAKDNQDLRRGKTWTVPAQLQHVESPERKDPLVSIVCYVYNRERFIAETIESVLSQTYRNIEFIILNDGSTDNTERIIKRYLSDPRIKYHYQENIGKSLLKFHELFNRSVGLSSGAYVCAIGADDIYLPDRIEKQVQEFRRHPELDISFCNAQIIDHAGNPTGNNFRHPKALTFNRFNLLRRLFTTNFIAHPAVMIRRQALDEHNGFETGYCSDFHFWLKTAQHLNFKYMDEVLWRYRVHDDAGTATKNNDLCADQTYQVLEFFYNKYSIEDFYPEISACSQKSEALFSAHLDLGIDALTAPFVYAHRFAIREFQKALSIREDSVEAQNNLAIAMVVAGDRREAAGLFRALGHGGDNGSVRHNIDVFEASSAENPRLQDYWILAEDTNSSELKRNILRFELRDDLLPGSTLTISERPDDTASMHRPTVKGLTSIIIATTDHADPLEVCLDALEKHTRESHEIIIVGNTPFIESIRSMERPDDPVKNLILLRSENPNYVGLINQGIGRSTGETIVVLRAGTIVTDGWLTGMLHCLHHTSKPGLVGPLTNFGSPPQLVPHACMQAQEDASRFASEFKGRNEHRRSRVGNLSGFCLSFRRDLISSIGLPDDSLSEGSSWATDYCLAASVAGYTNMLAADTYVHQETNHDTGTSKADLGRKWTKEAMRPDTNKRLGALNAIEEARKLYARDRLKDAVDALMEGLKLSFQDKDIYFCLARMLIDAGLHGDAIQALESMAKEHKEDIEYLELFGYAAEAIDRDEDAEACASKMLSKDAALSRAINLQGLIAYKRSQKKDAENFFRRAAQVDPGNGDPYRNRGLSQWSEGEKEEGLSLMEKAFILAPDSTDNRNSYYAAVCDTGSYGRAEPVFMEAQALYPESRAITFLLIDSLVKQEKFGEAIGQIEAAIVRFGAEQGLISAGHEIRRVLGPLVINPEDKEARTLSVCMIAKNEEDHMARCLESLKGVAGEIIVVDTGSTDETKQIAQVFGAQVFDVPWTNDFSEARNVSLSKAKGRWILVHDADEVISTQDYSKLLAIVDPKAEKPAAYTLITRNYTTNSSLQGWTANKGDYPDEEAGTGWFPSPKVRLFTNDRRVRFENPVHEILEPSLQRAGVKIKPCDIAVHHYGRLNEEKTMAKAETYYFLGKKKLDATGGDPSALRELAIQAGELGRHDEALELWNRYIAFQPESHVAHFNMSTCYFETGRFKEALDSAIKALTLDPLSKESVLCYASASLCAGSIKDAISSLEKLMERIPDYPPAKVVLAAAYCMGGTQSEGQDHLKEMRMRGYDCSTALYSLSKKLISADRMESAVNLLENMTQAGQSHPRTAELLNTCRSLADLTAAEHHMAAQTNVRG